MAEAPDKYREEAREVAAASHGASRDDRDRRQDALMADIVSMMRSQMQDTKEAVAAATEQVKRDFRLDEIERRLSDLEKLQETAQVSLSSIEQAANRWKGGFLVIVALGAIIGWLTSVGGRLAQMVK